MSILSSFHFLRPVWLALIPIMLWVWWLIRRSDDPLRRWRHVIQPELLDAMAVGGDNSRWRGVGLLVAWLLAALALAGPTWQPEPSPFADDPVPVMLVLKASATMDQSDLTPSRIERARLKAADFASERKGQPLGLIAYAGTSHLVLPPTRDTSVVAAMAAEISSSIMPKDGDDLTAALELAAETLGKSGGSIVVVADTVIGGGEEQLAEFHSEHRLPVHFLAVARGDTPEEDNLESAASRLAATTTMMTPDSKDIEELVRRTAKAPVAVAAVGEGTHWAEAGWWLVPIIAIFALVAFQREEQSNPEMTV